NPVPYWAKSYGGVGSDGHFCVDVQRTQDCGYIASGPTQSFGSPSGVWLLKLDPEGTIQWQKSYSIQDDAEYAVVQPTTDGAYVVAGWTFTYGFVFRIESDGTVGWAWEYPSGEVRAVRQTADCGFIVAGVIPNEFDGWVAKLDSLGNLTWQK